MAINFFKLNPTKDSEYEVGIDDGCFVVRQGENQVWLSKALVDYLAKSELGPVLK